MANVKRVLVVTGILVVLGLIVFFPGKKWARQHVNLKTAVEDHPLLCTNCHLHIHKNSPFSKLDYKEYLSPLNLAVSADGKLIFVVARDANEVLVTDAEKGKVLHKIPVGNKPHSIILDKLNKTAYVSNQWADFVSIIDLETLKVTDTLNTGNGPAGLSLSADEKSLYAVNSYGSDLTVIDLATGTEIKRLSAGNNPTGCQLSPDGKNLYITSRRAVIEAYGEPLYSELTILDDSSRRVKDFVRMESAYLMENVAFTPSGDLAIVTLIRPKNLVPSIQVERGFMMTHGIGIIEQKENGRRIQLLIDEPNRYFADPFDIVITPDGKKAFISSSGVNFITVVDIDSIRQLIDESTPEMLNLWPDHLGISSRYIIKRIETGANPKGLALSPDGKLLYVAEHLNDMISVISTEKLETINTIDLGGPRKVSVARQGKTSSK